MHYSGSSSVAGDSVRQLLAAAASGQELALGTQLGAFRVCRGGRVLIVEKIAAASRGKEGEGALARAREEAACRGASANLHATTGWYTRPTIPEIVDDTTFCSLLLLGVSDSEGICH